MSFWEDASPVVKGALVLGVVGVIAAAFMYFSDAGGGDTETTQERGFNPATAAPAGE